MSIFPKRTLRGTNVTIHWNFNTSQLKEHHVIPYVRIGVEDPKGEVTMLFEKHVIALPDPPDPENLPQEKKLKYLNKNLPLMILADYLSGKVKKEKLVQILQNIQSGKHYYFTFSIPEDAPLGKYKLVSEIHVKGEIRYSQTASEDFFFVEHVAVNDVAEEGSRRSAVVKNESSEKTPVKIKRCFFEDDGNMRTTVELFELESLETKNIDLSAPYNYLIYNEEREVILLNEFVDKFLLRNQQILQLDKQNGNVYLLKKDEDYAYQLDDVTKKIWKDADGYLNERTLSDKELTAAKELMDEGLLLAVKHD